MLTQLHRGNITVNGHVFLKCWAVLDDKKQFFKNQQDYNNAQEIISLFWNNQIDPYIGGEIIKLSFTSGKKDYSMIDLIGVARNDAKLRGVQDHLTQEDENTPIQIGNREFYSDPFSHFEYTDLMPQQRFWLTPKNRRRKFVLRPSKLSSIIDIALVSEETFQNQQTAFCGAEPPTPEFHLEESLPDYLL